MSDRIVVLDGGRIQQCGGPEDVYYRPANAFVARFIGESNLLAATVVSVDAAGSLVEIAGGTRVHLAGRSLTPGARATLLVRPEAIDLSAASETGGASAGAVRRDDGLLLSGSLVQAFFGGTDYRLAIEVAGLDPLKVTARGGIGAVSAGFAPGRPVALFVPQAAIHVLEGQP